MYQKEQNKTWLPFAILEGAARTGSLSTIKIIGSHISTLGEGVAATLVVGAVQSLGSLALSRDWSLLWLGWRFATLSLVFGLLATLQTVIPFVAFSGEAPLAAYVFIVVGISIVPATLIDVIFFGTKLSSVGWLGVAVAVAAGYVVLGAPALSQATSLDPWVWLSLLAMGAFAVNQGVVRAASRVKVPSGVDNLKRGLAQNIQVGIVTVVASAVALEVLGQGVTQGVFPSKVFVLQSIAVGGWVTLLVFSNMMSFALGANIPIKKTVATGVFLLGSAVLGWWWFDEPLSSRHFFGFVLYAAAFVLIDRDKQEEVPT